MNKKIKIILACLLSTSCLLVFSPVDFFLLTTKANAETSTYSLADDGELKSLDVQSTDGQSLELCDDYGGVEKNLTDDENYYVLLDGSSNGVKIFGEVEGKDYIAKVFQSDRKYAKPYDIGENIPLEKGQTTLYVRTYTSEDALKRAVDDEDVTDCSRTYKININKPPVNGEDDVRLEDLTLDSGKIPINFNRDILSYNVSIDEDQEDVEIKVRPSDESYTIKIGGFKVDEDNKYKKDLHLKYGINVIKIILIDLDYRIRTYTLNITRGNINTNENSTTNQSVTQSNSSASISKANQWVQVNGNWQYYDSTENFLKNSWYYDRNYNKTYYLKEDGTMATNWLYLKGSWYYLGQDGGMKIGWQNINGDWYYLDSNGAMKTGWIKDFNGKYYYLQSNGIMAKNTRIDEYKIGSNGAWVK
jgi:hypothetical protein